MTERGLTTNDTEPVGELALETDDGASLLELAIPLAGNLKVLLIGPLLAGLLALGATYLLAPTFTARTLFLPPQQQQSAAAGTIAALGALSGAFGSTIAVKSPADQYVALMKSNAVVDRVIDGFDLMNVYRVKYRFEARKELGKRVRIELGKKDGLIAVEVDDENPKRAADMANRHVAELRRVTDELALTEAKQRRVFFESALKQTRDKLTAAQQALESSGFSPSALRTEPKAAAEAYAQLKAEFTAAEVRLQTMRRSLADGTPEVQQQQSLLSALRGQLAKLEASPSARNDSDYIGRYREFKYQETLFDLLARQYEMARLDESRDGALIQIVDEAMPPEYKSKPKRALIAIATFTVAFVLLVAFVLARHFWSESAADPRRVEQLGRLRAAMGRR